MQFTPPNRSLLLCLGLVTSLFLPSSATASGPPWRPYGAAFKLGGGDGFCAEGSLKVKPSETNPVSVVVGAGECSDVDVDLATALPATASSITLPRLNAVSAATHTAGHDEVEDDIDFATVKLKFSRHLGSKDAFTGYLFGAGGFGFYKFKEIDRIEDGLNAELGIGLTIAKLRSSQLVFEASAQYHNVSSPEVDAEFYNALVGLRIFFGSRYKEEE